MKKKYLCLLKSNDIESNPGPSLGNCFKFCTWNLNSIAAYDFSRVALIDAYNTVNKYDIIALVETHLDSTIDLPENFCQTSKLHIEGYSFIRRDHPANTKRGGVSLFCKDSLAIIERNDLELLSECLVCELMIDRKKLFFVLIYRSPSQDHVDFQNFLEHFVKQCSEIETSSTLPSCNDVFEHSICDVAITNEAILKIIRALDPNKAYGWDGISVRMTRICDASLLVPLSLIYENCLKSRIFQKYGRTQTLCQCRKRRPNSY